MSKLNVCVAGYTEDNICIRPVLSHNPLKEKWLWSDTKDGREPIIRPFAAVEFDLLDNKPEPLAPHTEDWPIKSFYRSYQHLLTSDQQKELLHNTLYKNVESIFEGTLYGSGHGYIIAGEGKRSLGTIDPKKIREVHFDEQYSTYRLTFIDRAEKWYDLTVNDMTFRDYLYHSRIKTDKSPHELAEEITANLKRLQVYLRIGLARRFPQHPDRCYLQITGVHTFPDYLEGRCFADFVIDDDNQNLND